MKRIEKLNAVAYVQVGGGLSKFHNGLEDVVGRVAANLVKLVRGAVLNKFVGNAEADNLCWKTMVGHELENRTAEAAGQHSVFYSNDFSEPLENVE